MFEYFRANISELNLKHLLVEKHQRVQCLVLCARGDVPGGGQMREKRGDIAGVQFTRVTPAAVWAGAIGAAVKCQVTAYPLIIVDKKERQK